VTWEKKIPQKRLIRAKRKKTKKKNQKVPKGYFGSKREKEKEKKTKKRSIEPAIGVPRCAHRVPTTDRAGPGRAGQGTGPVPTWGYPFFSVSRLSLLSARWCCCIIRADESGRMIYIKTEGKEKENEELKSIQSEYKKSFRVFHHQQH
jgi:hypothetical protein